ncbi:MAG: hypothetical protein ACXIU8_11130 [Alkalilacustris sp.]
MPNLLAHIVLYAWPLVVILLFRKLPLSQALCWSVIAGYLFLPERTGINISMLPPVSKYTLPSMTALVMCLLLAQRDRLVEQMQTGVREDRARPSLVESLPVRGPALYIVYGVLVAACLWPVLTVLNNREALVYGPRVVPGMTDWDIGSMIQGGLVTFLPFVLGLWFLGTTQRHVALLRVLVVAGLAYSVLVAYEIRMSPQLNIMIYGFFPHNWGQHFRAGGFRPVVFLHHGLWLAIFMATAVAAACVLWRQSLREQISATPWIFAAGWLLVLLMLSRSLGAAAIALAFVPVILLVPPRIQILVAAAFSLVILFFPILRGAGWIPTDRILEIARSINPDRADSLAFRFHHEDLLLEKANQKPFTGWGSWGRNRVFDPVTGDDLSVTDGAWVIIMGVFGWAGYLARFGLLTVPVVLLAIRRHDHLAPATTGLALVACVGLADLIPNGTMTPVTWLIGGALAGRALRQERPIAGTQGVVLPADGPAWGGTDAAPVAHVRKARTDWGGAGPLAVGGPSRPASAGPMTDGPVTASPAPRHQRRPRG